MAKVLYIFAINLLLVAVSACSGSDSGNAQENYSYIESYDDDDDDYYSDSSDSYSRDDSYSHDDSYGQSGSTESYVYCPYCMGTGQDPYASNDIMASAYFGTACTFCSGNGVVTAEWAQQITQLTGGGAGSSRSSGGYSSGGSSERPCANCNGSGNCQFCGGKGWTEYESYYTGGQRYVTECSHCNGNGRCPMCYGRGTAY